MGRLKFTTIFLNTIFLFQESHACIWLSRYSDGQSVHWPSNRIEVCFNPPTSMNGNVLDEEYQLRYAQNRAQIQQVLQTQINARTPFQLQGFGTCARNDTSTSKIRIDLNDTNGSGARASSIGPRSGREPSNVQLSCLDFENNKETGEQRRVFNSPQFMRWVALHEVMHLLGFAHTQSWNSNNLGTEDELLAEVIRFGSGPDTHSIMNRERQIPVLSSRDVQCLQLVAERQIQNHSQAEHFIPTQPANSSIEH